MPDERPQAKLTVVVSLSADIWPSLATLQEQAAGNDWVGLTLSDADEKACLFGDVRNRAYEMARAGRLQITAFPDFAKLCTDMKALQKENDVANSELRLQVCAVEDKGP